MPAKKLTVAVALLTYKGADGRTRTARRGAKIELEGAELEKARRLEAVVDGDLPAAPGPVVEPVAPVPVSEAGQPIEAGGDPGSPADTGESTAPAGPERPSNGASRTLWKEYAIAQGMDEDEAEAATRDQLVALYPAQA